MFYGFVFFVFSSVNLLSGSATSSDDDWLESGTNLYAEYFELSVSNVKSDHFTLTGPSPGTWFMIFERHNPKTGKTDEARDYVRFEEEGFVVYSLKSLHVQPGMEYRITLRAYNNTPDLAGVALTSPAAPKGCVPPSNIHLKGSTSHTLNVAWNPVAGAVGYRVYWIKEQRRASNSYLYGFWETSEPELFLDELPPNWKVSVAVKTLFPQGGSQSSSYYPFTTEYEVCGPSGLVRFTKVTARSVSCSWDASQDCAAASDVQVRELGSTALLREYSGLVHTETLLVEDLEPLQEYEFRNRQVGPWGMTAWSAWSRTKTEKPPCGLAGFYWTFRGLDSGFPKMRLSWRLNSETDCEVSGFVVLIRVPGELGYFVNRLPSYQPYIELVGDPGEILEMRVATINEHEEASWSEWEDYRFPCPPPTTSVQFEEPDLAIQTWSECPSDFVVAELRDREFGLVTRQTMVKTNPWTDIYFPVFAEQTYDYRTAMAFEDDETLSFSEWRSVYPACEPPVLSTTRDVGRDHATIRWDRPDVDRFRIIYRQAGSSQSNTIFQDSNNIHDHYRTLHGLNPGTTYIYEIAADCGNGWTESAVGSFTTDPDGPSCGVPSGLNFSIQGQNGFLEWDPVPGADSYRIRIVENGNTGPVATHYLNASETTARISCGFGGGYLTASVSAECNGVSSPFSTSIGLGHYMFCGASKSGPETLEPPDSRPRWLKVDQVSDRDFVLHWQAEPGNLVRIRLQPLDGGETQTLTPNDLETVAGYFFLKDLAPDTVYKVQLIEKRRYERAWVILKSDWTYLYTDEISGENR